MTPEQVVAEANETFARWQRERTINELVEGMYAAWFIAVERQRKMK